MTITRPLYAIRNDLLTLDEFLGMIEGDPSRLPEQERAITDYMAALETEQAEKLDSLIGYTRELRGRATAAKAEAEQWATRAKALAARADAIEAGLKAHLEATGQPKVTTASGRTVCVQKNGGVAPVILAEAIDPETIPAEFVRVKKEINLELVRLFLGTGGTLTFAQLGERGTRLVVK